MSDDNVSKKTLELFEFIAEQQALKKDLTAVYNDRIKAAFNTIAGLEGDALAVKHVYQRWQKDQAERNRYDLTLVECNRQLGLDFDLKTTIQKIESFKINS